MSYFSVEEMLNIMSEVAAQERSQRYLTLGKLIAQLETLPPRSKVDSLVSPHSYRGYYRDLAFETVPKRMTAGRLLKTLRGCMGKTFAGYKGGKYVMGANTPLWAAAYGTCGAPILRLTEDGHFDLGNIE